MAIYLEVERRMETMTECDAIETLQSELEVTAKIGRSKKPNLALFNINVRRLRKSRESNIYEVWLAKVVFCILIDFCWIGTKINKNNKHLIIIMSFTFVTSLIEDSIVKEVTKEE